MKARRLKAPRRLQAALVTVGLASAGLVALAPPSVAAPEKVVAFERHAVDQARTGKVKDLPRKDKDASAGAKERDNATFAPASGGGSDPAVQTTPTATVTAAGLSAPGLGLDDNAFSVRYAPPDTNGSVGRTQYVQGVNTQFAVYDKTTGVRLAAPFFGSALFTAFGGAGSACATHDDGDPVVQYDKAAGRWLLTQFQVTVQPYLECVAVSDTEDATGSYRVYAYAYGSDFVDYPKIGVWPDAYDITYNVFNGGRFTGGEVCALDRTAILANPASAPPQKCFRTSTTYAGLLPADLDGTTAPAGDSYVVDISGGKLWSWRLHLDWTGATASTLTGPTQVAGAAAWTPACGSACVVQPGTNQRLDTLGDRLMNRLAFRVGPSGPALVVSHAVTYGGTKRQPGTAFRWYELRPNGTGLAVFQQGTYAPDATSRWMSSAAMDRNGAIAVGYSASSSAVFPALRVASRLATDPVGKLGAEKVLTAGRGSQAGSNLSRWGDYASMSVDPVDDCTLWFTSEYLTATGAFNWSTRIHSLRASAC